MKFREHRGGLAESMETVVELDSRGKFLEYFKHLILKSGFDGGTLSFSEYGYDKRIGWNTYLVCLEGYGVLGMLDGPPPVDWWPPVKFEHFEDKA